MKNIIENAEEVEVRMNPSTEAKLKKKHKYSESGIASILSQGLINLRQDEESGIGSLFFMPRFDKPTEERWECDALKAVEMGLPRRVREAMARELSGTAAIWVEDALREYELLSAEIDALEKEIDDMKAVVEDALQQELSGKDCRKRVVDRLSLEVRLMSRLTWKLQRAIEIENELKVQGLEIVKNDDGGYGLNEQAKGEERHGTSGALSRALKRARKGAKKGGAR